MVGRLIRLRQEVRQHRLRLAADQLQVVLEEHWYTLGRLDGAKR